MGDAPIAVLSFALCAAAVQGQEPRAPDVAAILGSFPDDGLPRLFETAQTAKGAAGAKALGRLGARAHEVAFGTLRSMQALPAHFVDAFSEVEATASWSVPLLVECIDRHTPNSGLALQVLRKLGDAAAPALRLALATTSPATRSALEPLLHGLKPGVAPPRPASLPPPADSTAIPALLDVLDRQPQAWPALQALLSSGDEGALEAALRLCEQLQNPARAADARRLLDVVHATYRARMSADPSGPWNMQRPARDAAIRRFILANHQPAAMLQWDDLLRSGRADLRRALALAAALRSPKGSKDPFVVWVLAHPAEIPPADVRPLEAPPASPPRPPGNPSAFTGPELVKLLRQLDSGPPQQRMQAKARLQGASVDAVPAEAVPLILQALAPHQLHNFAIQNLAKAGAAAVKPMLDAFAKADEMSRRTMLQVLAKIEPASATTVTFLLGKARDDKTPDGMAAHQALSQMRRADVGAVAVQLLSQKEWRGDVLRHARELLPADPQALAGRTDELVAALLELGENERWSLLDYLTQKPREGLELFHRWLAGENPELRLAALRQYCWRTNDPKWVDTVLALIRDPDPRVAALAVSACGRAEEQRPRVAGALIELWATASPELQTKLVPVFGNLGADAAAARPLLEPRLQAPGWGARLPAALSLLAFDQGHQAAQAVVHRLLGEDDPYTRGGALSGLKGCPELAPLFAAEIARSLDDADVQVVLEALYICEQVPALARDKRERLVELEKRAQVKEPSRDDWQVGDWARRVRERVDALAR